MEGGVAVLEADAPYQPLGRNTHSAEGPHHIGKLRWHRTELHVFIKVRRDFFLPKKNVLTKK